MHLLSSKIDSSWRTTRPISRNLQGPKPSLFPFGNDICPPCPKSRIEVHEDTCALSSARSIEAMAQRYSRQLDLYRHQRANRPEFSSSCDSQVGIDYEGFSLPFECFRFHTQALVVVAGGVCSGGSLLMLCRIWMSMLGRLPPCLQPFNKTDKRAGIVHALSKILG